MHPKVILAAIPKHGLFMGLLMAMAIFCIPADLQAANDSLVPGFAQANDSIRLRQVITHLIKVSKEGDAAMQKANIREVIRFCEERDFIRGTAAGHNMLHYHFSYSAQTDSALSEKKLMLAGYLSHLSCQNQLNFWLMSSGNLIETYQTDAGIQELYRAIDLADSCDLSKLNTYNSLAAVMENLRQYDEAVRYLKLGQTEMRHQKRFDTISLGVLYNNLSLQYDNLGEADSAMHYVSKAIGLYNHPAFRIRAANIAIRQNEFAEAHVQLDIAEDLIGVAAGLQPYRMTLLLTKARLAMRESDWSPANKYAEDALQRAVLSSKPATIASAYGIKAQSLLRQDKYLVDSFQHYLGIQKDEAVVNATVKFETQEKTAQKEQEILLLNSQLKDEAIRKLRWQNYFLFGGVTVLLLGIFALFLVRRRQQRAGRELERLRKQAVQLQMNPHFFFNSLNSINLFIARNEKDKASDYLMSFARIMRLTLENSQEETVLVEKEVEFLTNYLSLEQLRMKNFDFRIEVDDALKDGRIPPFLIQPLVENSIQHGFQDIDYRGDLLVKLGKRNARLVVEVVDNGLGIQPQTAPKDDAQAHQSFALSILRQRLANYAPVLGQLNFGAGIAAKDNPGTKVAFEIPLV